jgi:ribonuclease HII
VEPSAAPPAAPSARPAPDLSVETELFAAGHHLVAGIDEVGRGAWAGPLYVGIVAIDRSTPVPEGTRDSKLMTPKARQALCPELEAWCACWAIGTSSSREIDNVGLTRAQHLAVARAIASLPSRPGAVIVDGPIDFVTPGLSGRSEPIHVRSIVAADRSCGTVAAASVLAKVARDKKMSALGRRHPDYGFEQHKGYGTGAHAAAVEALGLLSGVHRLSWSIAPTRRSGECTNQIAEGAIVPKSINQW